MMRRPLVVLSAMSAMTGALALSLSSVAGADDQPAETPKTAEPGASGLRFSLRTGVALPIGSSFPGSGALSDTITGYVPLRLDIGYRIERHFYIGVDAELAAIVPAGCTSGFTCSGTHSRLGVMVAYHLRPSETFDPYFGVGTGYEVLRTSRSIDSTSVDIVARGFELIDLELGGDVRLGRSWRIGPVVSGSVGKFTTVAVNGTPSTDFETVLHAWVALGFRGAFDL